MVTMEKIVALCKRRGIIFPASEIYGGIANTYDYGHYGVLLKNNVIGACLTGTFGGALAVLGQETSDGALTTRVEGDIVLRNRVLVIAGIRVVYTVRLTEGVDPDHAHHAVVLVGEEVTVEHVRRYRIGVLADLHRQPDRGAWRHIDRVLPTTQLRWRRLPVDREHPDVPVEQFSDGAIRAALSFNSLASLN
jgi:hypothetical protein